MLQFFRKKNNDICLKTNQQGKKTTFQNEKRNNVSNYVFFQKVAEVKNDPDSGVFRENNEVSEITYSLQEACIIDLTKYPIGFQLQLLFISSFCRWRIETKSNNAITKLKAQKIKMNKKIKKNKIK